MLRSEDGLSLSRRLRRTQNAPVVPLTARNDDTDRIVRLEIGADTFCDQTLQPARSQGARRRCGRAPRAA